MAVRNQHSRQSKRYKIEIIEGIQYYVEPDTYISKSIIYQTLDKIKNNKLNIPSNLLESKKTILIICKGNGNYNYSLI